MTSHRSNLVASILAAAVVFLGATGTAEGRRRGGGSAARGRDFGIGLILGTPTGISGELRLSTKTSLDFAIGLDLLEDGDDGEIHVDYLVYLVELSRGGSVSVPLYLGVGGVLWDHGGRDFDDDLHIGVRVPFGIAVALRSAPVQFFFEIAVRVLLIDPHDHDDNIDLKGALGFRVYF